MNLFTIIDLETTGFGKYDRVVEIGLVKIDQYGDVIDTFSTLINPNRDIGASHIHGITATMVKDAPTFNDIYPYVNGFINQSVPVSHNKTFDFKFLKREMELCGVQDYELNGLCTLQLSRQIFPELPCRKLSSLCEYFDIDISNYHAALDDSIATAKVLSILLGEINDDRMFPAHDLYISTEGFTKVEFNREKSTTQQEVELNKLSKIIRRQPDFDSQSDYNVSEYLNLLDRILEDRIITDDEVQLVKDYTSDFAIPFSSISKIHEEYFRRLCCLYLDDDIISETEAVDLNIIRKLLGIDSSTSNLILELEKGSNKLEEKPVFNIYEGKTVCFTGALVCKVNGCKIDREKAHELAIAKGLVIKKGVSSKLDILVVADPNTNSGKAKKARNLSILIVAEMVFWSKVGIKTE